MCFNLLADRLPYLDLMETHSGSGSCQPGCGLSVSGARSAVRICLYNKDTLGRIRSLQRQFSPAGVGGSGQGQARARAELKPDSEQRLPPTAPRLPSVVTL